MENKFRQKNIFESGFDSFEFDDGFLLQVDADLKNNSVNQKEFRNSRKVNVKGVEKLDRGEKEHVNKNVDYYDLPLFIEDLNESDFFDFSKTKKISSNAKVENTHTDEKEEKDEKGKKSLLSGSVSNCLSPILGPRSFCRNKISASTPLKPNDNSESDGKPAFQKNQHLGDSPKNSEFDYLEADLFDDWNINESDKCATQKETVTLSQALKLIEEKVESIKGSASAKSQNDSIDLLTGEVITADMDNLFGQSFEEVKKDKKQDIKGKESLQDDIIIDNVIIRCKPAAAQKLHFDSENFNCPNADKVKKGEKDLGNICFSSDDDFDFFTQDLLGKSKPNQSNLGNKDDSVMALENYDLNESSEVVINSKRRKSINVIESDTTEESPSPKFRRQRKAKMLNSSNFQGNPRKDFFDLEAEVSEAVEVSSDEVEEDGEYDQSFVDEESYFTQNLSADMTAKYLESVKGFGRPGTFKIPAAKPYNPERIFSQVIEENDTDYQIDSFCVKDVEEETKTDLSDLEIAEKILEMDQKKRKKKRSQKSRKIR